MSLSSSVQKAQRRLEEWVTPQVLVIGGLFLACLIVAWRVSKHFYLEGILRDPLVLIFPLAGAALFLLRYPPVGLLALVVATLSIHFELSTGTQTRLNAGILVLMGLLGLWLFRMIVAKQRSLPVEDRSYLPLALFILLAVLSFLVGQLPWFMFAQKASVAAQLGGLALFVLAAGAYFLMGNQISSLKWLEGMVWIFLGLSGAYVFGQIIPGMRDLSASLINRGVFTHSLFWLWVAVMAFSQALFNRKLSTFLRFALMMLVLGVFFLRLVRESGWTSGWLPAAFGVGVILWVSGSRFAWLTLAGAAGALAAKADTIQRLLLAGDNEYSLMTRLEAWRIIFKIIEANPLLGLGPANYYWYTPLYAILGYTVQFNSHNNYMDLLAQVGVLGLVAFLWFVWEVWRLGWGLRKRAQPGFAQAYVYGVLGGLAGTLAAGMLGDWFLPFIYNIGFSGFRASLIAWLFLGGLVVIKKTALVYNPQQGELDKA